jgi:hypothetical protein
MGLRKFDLMSFSLVIIGCYSGFPIKTLCAILSTPRPHTYHVPCHLILLGLIARTKFGENRSEQTRIEQIRSEQNRSEQIRTDQNRSEQIRTDQNRIEQIRSEQNLEIACHLKFYQP